MSTARLKYTVTFHLLLVLLYLGPIQAVVAVCVNLFDVARELQTWADTCSQLLQVLIHVRLQYVFKPAESARIVCCLQSKAYEPKMLPSYLSAL